MSDIHIHINSDDQAPRTRTNLQEGGKGPAYWLDNLIRRINLCYDWKSFYQLEEDFSRIGLAIRDTSGGRKILCRLEDGAAVTRNIVDDYIFVGDNDRLDEEIAPRALEVINVFVETNAGRPQMMTHSDQLYNRDMKLYGKPIQLYNEEEAVSQQQITLIEHMIDD